MKQLSFIIPINREIKLLNNELKTAMTILVICQKTRKITSVTNFWSPEKIDYSGNRVNNSCNVYNE